jgi:MOSC domain-containing protein YiiM
MREVVVPSSLDSEGATFRACIASILERPIEGVPEPPAGEEIAGWRLTRWLGGLGLGLVRVSDVASFSWAGPWIGVVAGASGEGRRAVVMFGVPSGVAWDPSGVTESEGWRLEEGYVVSALDIALAMPAPATAPSGPGVVESIHVAPEAGAPAVAIDAARAFAARGLEGDRHVTGSGTFPSGLPGSALTLIEAEVCASFSPPLGADEHRRNVVTRGIDLNALVGHEFTIGEVRCRGARLCEPCTVVERYASRPVLRALVHRGGLRADILTDGVIHTGDRVAPV